MLLALLCASLLSAQDRVDIRQLHERIIAVVPIVGAGTYEDPKRPLFAPSKNERSESAIESFSWQPSDDGKYAIVEFVARDRQAFKHILSDARVLKTIERSSSKKDQDTRDLKQFRKDWSFDAGSANLDGKR